MLNLPQIAGVETSFAWTEADFKNMPCVGEKCAKLVQGAVPTSPEICAKHARGQENVEIVQNLCGGVPEQFLQNAWWGGGWVSESVSAPILPIFRGDSHFSARPSSIGK